MSTFLTFDIKSISKITFHNRKIIEESFADYYENVCTSINMTNFNKRDNSLASYYNFDLSENAKSELQLKRHNTHKLDLSECKGLVRTNSENFSPFFNQDRNSTSSLKNTLKCRNNTVSKVSAIEKAIINENIIDKYQNQERKISELLILDRESSSSYNNESEKNIMNSQINLKDNTLALLNCDLNQRWTDKSITFDG